jgi:hypothetical protein
VNHHGFTRSATKRHEAPRSATKRHEAGSGLALMQCYGAPQKMAKNDSTSTSKTSLPLIERYPVIFRTIVSNALLALKHTIK